MTGCRTAHPARDAAAADRPVVGGVLALLVGPANPTVTRNTIENQNSGKVPAVDGMSTADSAQATVYDDNGTADHLWKPV